ncbi:cache domain-containing sensor histidine kinase [Paenibacillus guangzhouensis]|uniref:cache domain-containing sensor histidine kinase n=1 Tax=Paenibacillus guangzhouensis TaxID=1473112 RepID=UPI001D122CE8|nr:sensor histidine kinase [Paenibacillus guangzhouensis]
MKLKSHSIRTRLIQFMLVVTTIPLVLSLIITLIHTRESIKEQSISENKKLIFQGKTNLANYLNNINRASIIVYSDPHFISNLSKSLDDYQAIAEIYSTMQNLQGSLPDIQQVYLHSRLSNQSTLITSSVPRREVREAPYAGIDKYLNPEVQTTNTEPPHPVHTYGFPPSPLEKTDLKVFTFYRSINRIPSTKQLAVLAMDVKLDGLAAICNQLYEAGEEQLYLVNDQGDIIYSGNKDEIGKSLKSLGLEDKLAVPHANQSGYVDKNNAMQIYERLEVPFANWTLIKQIPHAALYQRSTELTTINAVIAALALLAVILGTLFISIRITRPIKQLASYMNEIQTGRLDINIEVNSQDEIGTLSRRFRQMMDTINNLILRKYKLELANQTNQIRALQAQIDPHFLYNALQSIGTLALQHNVPRIYTLLTSLAEMMRYKMRSNEAKVTLQDEINHLKMYLDLQKERFDEQFDTTWDLAPSSLSAAIPKMTLQPLVENYFKHGMDPRLGAGRLSICSWIDEANPKRLFIEIENNGTSIPDESLAMLQASLAAHHQAGEEQRIDESASIGLHNVLMRLQLYSEEHASLKIENLTPHGVRVTLDYIWERE